MMFTYTLDLSRYTDKEVANMLTDGVITEEEYDSWLASQKQAFKVVSKPIARETARTQVTVKFESK